MATSNRLELRWYQEECVHRAQLENTVVCLPTGFGKTLIAARLIEYFLQRYPSKKVGFLVPTRALVEQQAEYCQQHCLGSAQMQVVVERLVGEEQASWGQREWNDCLGRSDILLGTAAVVQKAFLDGYIGVENFCLLIFDEAHNAVGNSPMASTMRDGVAPYVSRNRSSLPRILGLTASFVNGNLKGIEKKRKALEELLLSKIFCPDVESKFDDDDFIYVKWSDDKGDVGGQKAVVERHVTESMSAITYVKKIHNIVARCSHVFEELGASALFFYIEKVIIQQINAKASTLEQLKEKGTVAFANKLRQDVPILQGSLQRLSEKLIVEPDLKQASKKTNKLLCLIQLLEDVFARSGPTTRGIVFVEQVALVSSMAKQINDHFISLGKSIKCVAVAGTGWQNENDRSAQLDAFASGKAHVLVATAAVEEGIDVPGCAFVVRFSKIATTKAHIQGAGRARHKDAEIFYFENCPETERRKENKMFNTAKDTSLAVTDRELQQAAATMDAVVPGRHPFGDLNSDGVVNVFNCKQILNQYCSISLGRSVSPKKDLYTYRHDPGDTHKILRGVCYPTPNGWTCTTEADYKTFWAGVDMDAIFVAERTNKKTESEKEEMAFVYVVVVGLRRKGYLTVHNKPEKKFSFDTRRNCPVGAESLVPIQLKDRVFQSVRI